MRKLIVGVAVKVDVAMCLFALAAIIKALA